MTKLDEQVGGTHYKNKKIQPIQLYYTLGIDKHAFMSNILKYVSRYKDKNGLQDLDKAIHYLEFLRMSFTGELDTDCAGIIDYSSKNGLTEEEINAISSAWLFMETGDDRWYENSMKYLEKLRKRYQK